MKKIPTLFKREIINHKVTQVFNELSDPKLNIVLEGKTIPTVKYDGTAVLIKNGKLYCRYDNKKGKKLSEDAIPCCEPDPITGHWPNWIPAENDKKMYQYQIAAFEKFKNTFMEMVEDAEYKFDHINQTFEVIGPHFQKNPYNLDIDKLIPHGKTTIWDLKGFDYNSIKEGLETHRAEGIVFWYNNEPLCKIKARDFGIDWRKNK